jgi:probable F420-dependent oxidoreductase
MDCGRIGIWSAGLRSDELSAQSEIAEAAAEIEELGFGAIWLGSSPGIEHAARILEATSRIVVATGILSIWEHDAPEVAARYAGLKSDQRERFLLGLGVSHPVMVERYEKPYSAMVRYLDGLDAGATPVPASARVLAALGPRMLELARDRSAGAHPYLVTPEHTARAREILGPDRLLAPDLKVILETDPSRARSVAREYISIYLQLPNYTRNLLRMGFTEDDWAEGGSDRLIDATFAWGDADTVAQRVRAFHDAGADHVACQIVTGQHGFLPLPRRQWRELADILGLRSA